MTYRLPSPSVTQILVQPSQNLADSQLLPCLIGSNNQVIKNEPILLTYPVSNATITYPKLKPGAIIDTATVGITVANAIVQINATPISAGAHFVAGSQTVTITGAFAGAAHGDTITLSAAGGTYTIDTVVSNDAVTLIEVINHTTSAETFNITRNVGTVTGTMNGAVFALGHVTITSLTYGTSNYVFVDGDAGMSYVAKRKDLLGFYEVSNQDTLTADMDLDILNPLGFNLGIAMASAGALKRLAYITPDETEASYIAALEDLATRRGPYMIASTLFNNSNVQGDVASHVEVVSQPLKSMFRSGIVTTPLVQQVTLATGTYTK